MATPIAPSDEFAYRSMGYAEDDGKYWQVLGLSALVGALLGGLMTHGLHELWQPAPPPPWEHYTRFTHVGWLSPMPAPCEGWEKRCLAGADAANSQHQGKFWSADLCSESKKGKLSCANRHLAWVSPSAAQTPATEGAQASTNDYGLVTDRLARPTLFLFMPGTGTSTDKVQSLLDAAADMGYHVLGLSYAAMPTAVSHMNLWCTRPKANASRCMMELHESVLFGVASTDAGGGGLWDVPHNQSVAHLAASALQELQWSDFLTPDGRVRWEHVVVSGHSQGASHAAYLSVVVPVRGAVLFSGPQEAPECAEGWLTAGAPTLRRAVYALHEECGDQPKVTSYCSTHPHLLRRNLEQMGLARGLVGNQSGYVVVDFPPMIDEGRAHHDAVALTGHAPPPVEAIWKTLLARLD